ncbi:MAG: FAD-dependent oxidoreductase [Armatimonadota bacterium]|nr:FAD-dependent oxidoreductase [Armatimonadota bacterium]
MSHIVLLLVLGTLTNPVSAEPLPQPDSQKQASPLNYFSYAREHRFPTIVEADVCVYGGTSAGVIAAVQLSRLGKTVVIAEPSDHLGGLSSGGLSFTDIGNKKAIGGLSREFYRRTGQQYGVEEEWRFEPHIAELIFKEMIEEANVPVFFRHFLQRVGKSGVRIQEIETRGGAIIRAKMFIDASYEGDLMAQAGVTFRQGREGNYEQGETINGFQLRDKHQFEFSVDPYVVEGDPHSGLLPGILTGPPGEIGDGDLAIQAYNFRLCLTKDPQNKLPFPKPENYDPQQYELLRRYLATGWENLFYGIVPIRNKKFDMNNAGAVSTDYIGMNHDYPGADYEWRERIFQQHVNYQKGLMWFLANDPAVPARVRARVNEYGLCKDEFVDTGGWPHQLYIREARRMVADYIMNEHNCRGTRVAPDPVGLAAYTMDSHNCNRFTVDDQVWNEGDIQASGFPPYPISYRSIIPRKNECENLLVPVCLATTHIAYGSIRMEPVFMILGHSAADAAALAIDRQSAVQDVPYAELRRVLEQGRQVLAWTG